MRLSESLRKNIMETSVGGVFVMNKFRLGKRRDTLFFEEILARFVLECEKNGAGPELERIGRRWMFLYFNTLVSETIRKVPPAFLLNRIVKKIWHNFGVMDDYHIEKRGDTARIITKNEGMTRYIGPNSLMRGFHIGIINVLFHSSAQPLKIDQRKESCEYVFRLVGEPVFIRGKTKELYRKLNEVVPVRGRTLKDTLEKKIFTIRDNRVYFRGKSISPVENTLFHLVGGSGIFPEKIAEVSYGFFKEIIREDATREEKISLLKTLFQVMGWGIIEVVIKERGIRVEIRNPPYSLTLKDDWSYIFRTFLGYLWLFDRKMKMSGIRQAGASVSAEYSR